MGVYRGRKSRKMVGGAREGAGRKNLIPTEDTVMLYVRMPVSLREQMREAGIVSEVVRSLIRREIRKRGRG